MLRDPHNQMDFGSRSTELDQDSIYQEVFVLQTLSLLTSYKDAGFSCKTTTVHAVRGPGFRTILCRHSKPTWPEEEGQKHPVRHATSEDLLNDGLQCCTDKSTLFRSATFLNKKEFKICSKKCSYFWEGSHWSKSSSQLLHTPFFARIWTWFIGPSICWRP